MIIVIITGSIRCFGWGSPKEYPFFAAVLLPNTEDFIKLWLSQQFAVPKASQVSYSLGGRPVCRSKWWWCCWTCWTEWANV